MEKPTTYFEETYRCENNSKEGLAIYREWRINEKRLFTPMVFLGINNRKKPLPWNEGLQVQGILVNGLELLKSKILPEYVQKNQSFPLNDFMDFNGVIMLDSGAFKTMELYSKMNSNDKKFYASVTTSNYINFYKRTRPDFVVIPDFPYHPEARLIDNLERLGKNLKMLRQFSKSLIQNGNSVAIPVFHPFPHPHFNRRIREIMKKKNYPYIKRLLEKTPVIGVGGIVPYLLNRKGKGFIKPSDLIDFICWTRITYPNKLLHVFGAGGSTIMPILFYLGVDSIDTTGWRIRAAYGKIQTLSTGDRSVHGTKSWPSKSIYKDDIAIRQLKKCNCPACTMIRKNHLDIEFFRTEMGNQSFKLRAIHNAYTYLQQAQRFRTAIKEGDNIKKYVKQLLEGNHWASNLFKIACEKVERYKLSKHFGWV